VYLYYLCNHSDQEDELKKLMRDLEAKMAEKPISEKRMRKEPARYDDEEDGLASTSSGKGKQTVIICLLCTRCLLLLG
jgi:hypothetical protein